MFFLLLGSYNTLNQGRKRQHETYHRSHLMKGKLCERPRVCESVCVPPLHIWLCMSLTAGSLNQQCCLAGLGAARADLIFVADSACKYAFVPFHCG